MKRLRSIRQNKTQQSWNINLPNEKDFYLTRYALIIKRLESSPATYSQLEDYLLNSFEFQDAESRATLSVPCRGISVKFPIFSTFPFTIKKR
jgi:hypothetical protein